MFQWLEIGIAQGIKSVFHRKPSDGIFAENPGCPLFPSKVKNSHILPTGQWYAPSAVINDALIIQ